MFYNMVLIIEKEVIMERIIKFDIEISSKNELS